MCHFLYISVEWCGKINDQFKQRKYKASEILQDLLTDVIWPWQTFTNWLNSHVVLQTQRHRTPSYI